MGLLRWLDHWIYARKWTKCKKCDKMAFCYYGVCWPRTDGRGNDCGMGCPACKQETEEQRAKTNLVLIEEIRGPVAPVVNRRAAVMATRMKYGQDQSRT